MRVRVQVQVIEPVPHAARLPRRPGNLPPCWGTADRGERVLGRERGRWLVGRVRRVLLYLVLAFCVYAVFKSPDQAAAIVRAGWDGIVAGLSAIASFFDALLNR